MAKQIGIMLLLCLAAAKEWQETYDKDLCAKVKCKKPPGSMCTVVEKNGEPSTTCSCPTECSDEYEPVCSVFGREYDNRCKLHLQACSKRKHIAVAFEGKCIASQEPCSADEYMQFPHRLLLWFVHLKEIDEFGSIHPDSSLRTMDVAEREEIAKWKFDLLDRKGDGKLDRRDLRDFRYALMPLEHCADEFFKSCDVDNNVKLTLDEWYDCLKVSSESYEDSDEL
uniref:SPARC-like isoform X1 n=1 Tax=Saccoglossus kowalevskii TaxID=10224 RepID=A0ABM0GRM5_SACKO|nr:PREDICTED: SPARC-like isoform X1 [Saccoglossus kowalevskii]